MNNIQILSSHPNDKGTFISYSLVFKPTDHTISGSFTATDNDMKQVFGTNHTDQIWNGFKQLVLNRIKSDVMAFDSQNASK